VDPHVLLTKLRGLLENPPPLEGKGAYSHEQFAWLGRASALIASWNGAEATAFKIATQAMAGNLNRVYNHGIVFTTIYNAITSIEENLPHSEDQAFGPGAVYDFFQALTRVISSAEKSLFLIDPYIDAEVFDGYLSSLNQPRSIRLLVAKYPDIVRVAVSKFRSQHFVEIEARRSTEIHDRVIFVDGTECWVLGASIKDAGKRASYLAPLSSDVATVKLQMYERIWAGSSAI
jgi:hypothetical protein